MSFFDKSDQTLDRSKTYTYTTANDYEVNMTGWTHTRKYAKGYMRGNSYPGVAYATVTGLVPNTEYNYEVFSYSSKDYQG